MRVLRHLHRLHSSRHGDSDRFVSFTPFVHIPDFPITYDIPLESGFDSLHNHTNFTTVELPDLKRPKWRFRRLKLLRRASLCPCGAGGDKRRLGGVRTEACGQLVFIWGAEEQRIDETSEIEQVAVRRCFLALDFPSSFC